MSLIRRADTIGQNYISMQMQTNRNIIILPKSASQVHNRIIPCSSSAPHVSLARNQPGRAFRLAPLGNGRPSAEVLTTPDSSLDTACSYAACVRRMSPSLTQMPWGFFASPGFNLYQTVLFFLSSSMQQIVYFIPF